jgi:glycosyltransferase involved in cell wall biosynthesis
MERQVVLKSLKVGFLSSQNYLDRNSFSGILYYMRNALIARGIKVIDLGEPRKPSRLRDFYYRVLKSGNTPKVGSNRYIAESTKFASKIKKQLSQIPCDVIFAPVAKREISFIETNIPIVSLSDATFILFEKNYQINLDKEEREWESKQESIAISKASKLVYSSEWAANSAISDYQADAAKIEVIPFGANLDEPPLATEVLSQKHTSSCRLLFIGRDWSRKGGDIAFQTLTCLNERGVNAELVVVGTTPPPEIKHEKLRVIPYLNKNVPQQRKQLDELFLKSNFFIFPTRADCSPIVICEANAFGLPVFTTDVGGIPTIIKNGRNGYMLPLSASGEDYANLIVEKFSDKGVYDNLARSSREEYDTRLNWDKWAESLHQVIMSIK